MPASPFFSGRIPQSLCDAIEERRQQTNESKTEILIKALSSYINHPVELPSPPQATTLETSRIVALEKKFEDMEQKLHALQSELTTKSTIFTPVEQSSPDPADEIEEVSNQIPLDLEESTAQVIKLDDSADNTENNQSSSPFIGTMKTLEVMKLPGLEDEDPKKLKTKLNNSINTKIKAIQIGSYTIALSKEVREASPGKRRELLWDVSKNENETPVINADNSNDN